MGEIADLLMLRGVVRECPDCDDDQLFVPIEGTDDGAYCCTTCGAAVLVDPLVDVLVDRFADTASHKSAIAGRVA